MILYSPGSSCAFRRSSCHVRPPRRRETYFPFSSLAIVQFWKYFHTVPSPDFSTRLQLFSASGRTETNLPSFLYSMERSSGFSLAGIPRVLAMATKRIFFERVLPTPIFRHPEGVVITLALSLSGREMIFLSTAVQIAAGSSRKPAFSSSENSASTAALYFIRTSSSTLGFRTYFTKTECSIFSS